MIDDVTVLLSHWRIDLKTDPIVIAEVNNPFNYSWREEEHNIGSTCVEMLREMCVLALLVDMAAMSQKPVFMNYDFILLN